MAGKGKNYENTLVNAITSVTTDDVWCGAVGYSGNAAGDHCDLMVAVSPQVTTTHDAVLHAIEAKKRSGKAGNRVYLRGGSDADTGVEELRRLVEETPSWSRAWLAVKFDRRELMVVRADRLYRVCTTETTLSGGPIALLDPQVTDAGSIGLRKPTTDEWNSATVGNSDEEVVVEALGLPSQTTVTTS